MANFASWLLNFARNFLTWLYNIGIDFLQALNDSLVTFIISVVSLFPSGSPVPDGPVKPVGDTVDIFLNCLNWLFPLQYLMIVSGFIVAGMLSYVIIAPLARWAKLLS